MELLLGFDYPYYKALENLIQVGARHLSADSLHRVRRRGGAHHDPVSQDADHRDGRSAFDEDTRGFHRVSPAFYLRFAGGTQGTNRALCAV
jgi:hypothetical protein